jgi:glycosyltransferase EpsE
VPEHSLSLAIDPLTMVADAGQNISVCLLTFNHGHMIEATVRSVLDQSLRDFEVIISDDCSTDDSWAKLEGIARGDDRVRLIRTPKNLGMAENANFAVAHSTRPYVALLHHDDVYRRDLLEKWVAVMARWPDIGFVFNAYALDGSTHVWSEDIGGERTNGMAFLNRYMLSRWGCPVRGTAMISRAAWQDVGGMRPRFNLLADVDLWMRLAMRGAVGYVEEPIIAVRQDRPEDYPAEYKTQNWSWMRQRYLYEIHIDNRRAAHLDRGLRGWLSWQRFRLRLNLETAKWLTYALVRGKRDMIASSDDGATECDSGLLRLYRAILKKAVPRAGQRSA